MRPPSQKRGFSLLELLAVFVLMAILLTIGMEGYSAMARAAALTTAADTINDAFTEARQDAMTQNIPVEIRLYALPSPASSVPVYSTLQLHWLKPEGTTPPAGAPCFLPTSVTIDTTPTHSSLIANNPQPATPDTTDMRLNTQTRVFHFLPDGSTDLNPSGKWFLTVRSVTQSDPAHFPSNWACVQIDPTTGRSQIRRP